MKQKEEEYFTEVNEARERLKSRSPSRYLKKELGQEGKESIRIEKAKMEQQRQEQVFTHRPKISNKSQKLVKKKEWQSVIDHLTQDIQKRNLKKEQNQKRS